MKRRGKRFAVVGIHLVWLVALGAPALQLAAEEVLKKKDNHSKVSPTEKAEKRTQIEAEKRLRLKPAEEALISSSQQQRAPETPLTCPPVWVSPCPNKSESGRAQSEVLITAVVQDNTEGAEKCEENPACNGEKPEKPEGPRGSAVQSEPRKTPVVGFSEPTGCFVESDCTQPKPEEPKSKEGG